MHITVTFVGILAEFIQQETVQVHLPQEATYGDLLKEIWSQFGHSIPDPLWDREANRFKEPIFALANGRAIDSPTTPLTDGEEVKFLTLVAGG
jgi:molybdopterin converting factor small subunit